jgi:hypothetical protein
MHGTVRVSHAVPARAASDVAESASKSRLCLIVSPVSPILKLTKECKTADYGTGISWLSALFAGTGGTSPTNTGIARFAAPGTADSNRERCQGTSRQRIPALGFHLEVIVPPPPRPAIRRFLRSFYERLDYISCDGSARQRVIVIR